MIMPCPNRIDCPGTDSPFANLSSEDPDQISYPGIHITPFDPELGKIWKTSTCFGECVSYVSQEDADACAKLVADLCNGGGGPGDGSGDPGGGNPAVPPVFFNGTGSCSASCPDGTAFSFTVAQGLFVGTSQIDADTKAHTYACAKASEIRICLGDIATYACLGSVYASSVILTPSRTAYFSVVGGALPDGLVFQGGLQTDGAASIVGTPTESGSFNFTVRAVDLFGNYMVKSYTIKVIKFNDSTLPDGTFESAYSYQLTATALGAAYTWAVTEGQLPPGLFLDASSGEIYGTCEEVGNYQFTVCLVGV